MLIDGKLVLTFLETVVFFGILGWAVDVWLRTKQVYLYPAYGLIVFGVVAIPLTYLINGFHLAVILGVSVGIVGAGILGTIRFGLPHRIRFGWHPQRVLIGIIAAGLVTLSLVQASKYAIPGGIDSAIHSSIINGIVASGTGLQGTYPLGMHITIYSLEQLFQAQQELVFLSLYLLLFMSALAAVAYIADRMTKRPLAGYLALAVGCIDVSLFNNYINGSGTHVVAIAFSSFLLVAAVVLQKNKQWARILGLAVALSIIWYFHYPTIFFALPLLWAWRLGTRQQSSWQYILALGLSLIISLPLQFKLFHDPLYVRLIGPGLAAIILVELALKFGARFIQRFLWHRGTLLALAIGSAWLFYHYSNSFLFIPTWYGVMIIRLALAGLFAAVLNRQPFSVFALLSFAMLSIIHAAIQLPPLVDHSKVMVELFYYFGFTISLILLGISGADGIKQLIHSRHWQQLVISLVALYAILVVVSRSFDQQYVGTILANDRPVSRYDSSKGFGIFYTKNDATLAAWVKNNILDNNIIANPGGLYNSWAALTEHPTLWATYNVPTVTDPEQYIATIKHLLRGEPGADVDLLLRRGIKYILLPEQYATAIYHPRVRLLQQIGQARFYQLLDSATLAISPMPIGATATSEGITAIINGRTWCRYCGNTFYFTDQNVLQELEVPPLGVLTLTVPNKAIGTHHQMSVLVDHSDGTIDYRTDNSQWKTSTFEKIPLSITPGAKQQIIQLRNSSTTQAIYIYASAVEFSQ